MQGSQRHSIRRLAPHESSQLRAACALPRLAAIAEELVCNSIDAGATDIAVSLDLASFAVAVRDNGRGMTESELRVVGDRHATSKLASIAELEGGVSTFGFRGEALHCLASISSRLEIVSCAASSPSTTYCAVLADGRRLSVGPAREARGVGTTIAVHDIYGNRPVARKQLQRPGAAHAEMELTRKRLASLCLSQPGVSLRLSDATRGNGTPPILNAPRASSLLGRLRQLLGPAADALPPLMPIELDDARGSGFALQGYAAPPPSGLRSRECQFLFVNRRPLAKRAELTKLAETAFAKVHAACFASLGPHGQRGAANAPPPSSVEQPCFLLFLECAPHRFDLTLEPDKSDAIWSDGGYAANTFLAKTLVRFFAAHCPQVSTGSLQRLLESLLPTGIAPPTQPPPPNAAPSGGTGMGIVISAPPRSASSRRRHGSSANAHKPTTLISSTSLLADDGGGGNETDGGLLAPMGAQSIVPAQPPPMPSSSSMHQPELHVSRDTLRSLVVIGQIERKFIAATAERSLFILDQHAADERVQFEKLLRATIDDRTGLPRADLTSPDILSTKRLRPSVRLTPTPHEMMLLQRHAPKHRAWGWELREGGEGVVGLECVPSIQGVELGAPALLEYCTALESTGGGSTLPPPAVLRVLASKACRRAVMFGDLLDRSRCQQILRELAMCDLPFQCAHGRPTVTPVLALDALPREREGA